MLFLSRNLVIKYCFEHFFQQNSLQTDFYSIKIIITINKEININNNNK